VTITARHVVWSILIIGILGLVFRIPIFMFLFPTLLLLWFGYMMYLNSFNTRAIAYIRKQKYPEAERELRQAIAVSGNLSLMLHLNLSLVLARQGQISQALKVLDKLIEIHPHTGVLYNNRAYLLATADFLEAALADSHKAVELAPRYPNAYGTRGHTYSLLQIYDEALADFVKSAELKPDHTFAIAGQAITHHASGNIEAAKKLWRSLIDIDARYASAEALVDDWYPAEAFVNEARKIVASLKTP
jgi:tetratricopeptide (TPR) repeat protein